MNYYSIPEMASMLDVCRETIKKYIKRNHCFGKPGKDITGKTNTAIIWKMFPYIEGVVESLAKKKVCVGCKVPDFEGKSFEASLRVMNYYKTFPYFRAKKLENVAFHKVREVFLDGNLKLNERTRDFDYVLELEREREKIEMGGISDVCETDGIEN